MKQLFGVGFTRLQNLVPFQLVFESRLGVVQALGYPHKLRERFQQPSRLLAKPRAKNLSHHSKSTVSIIWSTQVFQGAGELHLGHGGVCGIVAETLRLSPQQLFEREQNESAAAGIPSPVL